jgi:hypothetical protein
MIKKVASLGLLVGAVTSVILVASLIPASSQQATTKTFTLCEKGNAGIVKEIDVGRHGFSAGDFQLNDSPVYKPSTGHRVATDVGKQTIVHRIGNHDAKVIIDATLITKAGKLTAYGPARFSRFRKGVKFAITGGTGTYRQADGVVRVTEGRCAGKAGIHLTFRLILE